MIAYERVANQGEYTCDEAGLLLNRLRMLLPLGMGRRRHRSLCEFLMEMMLRTLLADESKTGLPSVSEDCLRSSGHDCRSHFQAMYVGMHI